MNRATEIIVKTAYSSAIILAAILKTRYASRLARYPLPAFLSAHILIERERRLGTRQTPGIILIFKSLMCLILS